MDYTEQYLAHRRAEIAARVHQRYVKHLEAVAEAARDYFRAGALTEYSAAIRLGAAVEQLDALDKEE